MKKLLSITAVLVLGNVLVLAGPGGPNGGWQPGAAPPLEWVPGELIVGFADVPTAAALADVEAVLATEATWRSIRHAPHYKGRPGVPHPLSLVRVATVPADQDILKLARRAARVRGVRYAEPNYTVQLSLVPNDPLYSLQYGPQIIDAEAAWDITTGDVSVIIGVIDTGLNFNHEDFQGDAVWINDDPLDGIDNDENGYIDDTYGWDFQGDDRDPTDGYGHGSHVSGISAARLNNGIGIAGLGNFAIMTLKVFNASGGGATWEGVAEAVYYAADNDAAVANLSLGGYSGAQVLADACAYSYDIGMTVVGAAGNYGSSTKFYPAAYPTVLAISGTDSADERYTSSNYGTWIDVAAPAVDVYSCDVGWSSAYDYKTGTSMAAPHVAGLAGLMYTVKPDLTPDEVRQLLRDNAVDLGSPGFDIYFGWGRIDAYATLQAVLALGGKTLPESYEIIRGIYVAGELSDLFESDDSRLVIQVGFTLGSFEPPVWVVVTGTAPTASPAELRFTLEARTNTTGLLMQKIELFNYVTQSYEEVDAQATSTTDSVVEVVISDDPARFVDPATQEMMAQLTWKPAGPVLFFPWNVQIDQTVWTITP